MSELVKSPDLKLNESAAVGPLKEPRNLCELKNVVKKNGVMLLHDDENNYFKLLLHSNESLFLWVSFLFNNGTLFFSSLYFPGTKTHNQMIFFYVCVYTHIFFT